jgi:predicted transcriptional regulator
VKKRPSRDRSIAAAWETAALAARVRADHAERQVATVRAGLERMARGRHVLIRRAARKLLRQMLEVSR